jgi:hypothetical protein
MAPEDSRQTRSERPRLYLEHFITVHCPEEHSEPTYRVMPLELFQGAAPYFPLFRPGI